MGKKNGEVERSKKTDNEAIIGLLVLKREMKLMKFCENSFFFFLFFFSSLPISFIKESFLKLYFVFNRYRSFEDLF